MPVSRPHWLSTLGDLEGHREVWLSIMAPAAAGSSSTHRAPEGSTCLSPLCTVGGCGCHVLCQHLFSGPPACGWVWPCRRGLASPQRPVPQNHSVQRSVPGAVLPALCLAIFILRVGNAFLQEAHLRDQSLQLHGMAGLCRLLYWLPLPRTVTETHQLTGQDKSGFSTTVASAHLWLRTPLPPPLAGLNRTVKSLWCPLGGNGWGELGFWAPATGASSAVARGVLSPWLYSWQVMELPSGGGALVRSTGASPEAMALSSCL